MDKKPTGPLQNRYMPNGYVPNIQGLVSGAMQDVATQPKAQRPGVMSLAVNHPGFLGYAIRDANEYDDAVKHDQLVNRLRQIRSQWPGHFKDATAYQAEDGTAVKWGDVPLDYDTTPSPYKWRGAFAPGQPLREGSDWIRSVFSTPQNFLRVAAHGSEVTPEQQEANRDFATGLDTALLGIPSAVMGQDANPAWSQSKDLPFASIGRFMDNHPGHKQDALTGLYDTTRSEERGGITGFSEAFRELGAPDSLVTDVVGGIGDAVTDPFPFGAAAIKRALAAELLPAAWNMGKELVPYVGLNVATSPSIWKTPDQPPPPPPVDQRHWTEYH